MPIAVQRTCGVVIGDHYPRPVVDEKATARVAKERVAAVKKRSRTKAEAQRVYVKHGSRSNMGRKERGAGGGGKEGGAPGGKGGENGGTRGGAIGGKDGGKDGQGRGGMDAFLSSTSSSSAPAAVGGGVKRKVDTDVGGTEAPRGGKRLAAGGGGGGGGGGGQTSILAMLTAPHLTAPRPTAHYDRPHVPSSLSSSSASSSSSSYAALGPWTCPACTYTNTKPLAPVCEICSTPKAAIDDT
jgi:hypothetical protein